jgi:nucleotide-binding universal stress UspA family protein
LKFNGFGLFYFRSLLPRFFYQIKKECVVNLSSIMTILDKPKHEQFALRRALELQKMTNAHLDLVSFFWNAMVEDHHSFDKAQISKLRDGLIDDRYQWMHDLTAKLTGDFSLRPIWTDNIPHWVEGDVAEKQPDLVIKTVNKSKTLTHTPTDWMLLEKCTAPLLLTSNKPHKPSGVVLAAIDLRHTDTQHRRLNCKVLDTAFHYAEMTGGKVHCVYAIEISNVLRDLDLVDTRASKKQALERITPELERLLKPYHLPKSRVHLPVGKAGKVLAQVSRQLKADLLVLGSNSHRIKQWAGIGNSAQRILTRAVCDVLAVHP